MLGGLRKLGQFSLISSQSGFRIFSDPRFRKTKKIVTRLDLILDRVETQIQFNPS